VLVQPGNTPPVAAIQSPAPGATFVVGQTITLKGTGTDAQDGTLAASRLSWTVLLHHDTHVHPFLGPVVGSGFVFTAPAPEDLAAAATSYLEVQLTATDFSGATDTATRDLLPQKVDLTFATVPPGLGLMVNGFPLTGPQTVASWQGWQLQATAPYAQTSGPDTFVFYSWSTGSANPLVITTPASPATYTATFQRAVDEGPLNFFTVAPCRLVDTRRQAGPLGGPALVAGGEREFDVLGACGISAGARAIAVNVTVTGSTKPGSLYLWATDELRPASSIVEFTAGSARANNAVLRLGPSGGFSTFCATASGSTHLIVDVTGYFE